MFENGTIIGKKKAKRKEFIGLDDAITDSITVTIFVPKDKQVVQFYDDDYKLLFEVTIVEMLRASNPIQLAKVAMEMINKLKHNET